MAKRDKSNFFKSIMFNVYVRNFILMFIVAFALIGGILFALNIYTRHSNSIIVPNLKGMQPDEAARLVSDIKLNYEVIDSLYKENGVAGAILEQVPTENSHVKKGRTIYLTVQSFNEPMIAIPDLEDASLRQSQTLLTTLGLNKINVEYIPSEYKDLVYAVEYNGRVLKPGQKVPKNAIITIKVGNGNGTNSETENSENINITPSSEENELSKQ